MNECVISLPHYVPRPFLATGSFLARFTKEPQLSFGSIAALDRQNESSVMSTGGCWDLHTSDVTSKWFFLYYKSFHLIPSSAPPIFVRVREKK
jgi:hypothetical protein